MALWSSDIDDTIYSVVKYSFPEELKTRFPNINFTKRDINGTPAQFPTVKIKPIAKAERGQDLDNRTVNAIELTLQIDVIANTNQGDADVVMDAVLEILKGMRFNFPSMAIASQEGDIFRSVARAKRVIGNGDKL